MCNSELQISLANRNSILIREITATINSFDSTELKQFFLLLDQNIINCIRAMKYIFRFKKTNTSPLVG